MSIIAASKLDLANACPAAFEALQEWRASGSAEAFAKFEDVLYDYLQQQLVPPRPPGAKRIPDWNPTNVQIATVMAFRGTEFQQAEARAFFLHHLNHLRILL